MYLDHFGWEDPEIPIGSSKNDWKNYFENLDIIVFELFELIDSFDWTYEELLIEIQYYFRPMALKLMDDFTLVRVVNLVFSKNIFC